MWPFLSLNYCREKQKKKKTRKNTTLALESFLSFSLFSSLGTTRHYISLYLIHLISCFRGIRLFIHSRQQASNLRPWHTRNDAKIYFTQKQQKQMGHTYKLFRGHNFHGRKRNRNRKIFSFRKQLRSVFLLFCLFSFVFFCFFAFQIRWVKS